MFSYKIIKHEDTENGTLYALYETTTDESGDVLVMWQAPVNHVFYESVEELVAHVTDLYDYVKQVETGEQAVMDSEEVTFVEMENESCCEERCECGDDCDCDDEWCGCGDWEWKSLDDEDGTVGGTNLGHHHEKKEGCCGGHCGCSH